MRVLALAEEFLFGGWTVGIATGAETFATAPAVEKAAIEKLVVSVSREEEASALARRWPAGADVFVVDHYEREAAFEHACRPWAKRIVAIDDLADRRHDANVLIDAANPAAAYRGLVPGECEVLAGPDFAILHPEFRRVRAAALALRKDRPVQRILISFGQIDSPNATTRALATLDAAGFRGHVDVVLGPAAPHLAGVRAAARPNTHVHIGAGDMPKLMSEADIALGGGGVTAWERCCVGLPSIVVALAENQLQTIGVIAKAGAAINAGPIDDGTSERMGRALEEILSTVARRDAMARAGATLVDGQGARRVLITSIGPIKTKGGATMRLRLAGRDDAAWLLLLQGKPETRRFANDQAAPSTDGHHRWLDATLADPSRLLAIAEVDDEPAAMLRLDSNDDSDRVNIAVDPDYHRQGIGASVLEFAARLRPGRTLEAEVLPGNDASLALFLGAGYRRASERFLRREPT